MFSVGDLVEYKTLKYGIGMIGFIENIENSDYRALFRVIWFNGTSSLYAANELKFVEA